MINNKKVYLFALAMLFHIVAIAQSEVLTLYKKDGSTVQYSFITNPRIYQDSGNLLMKTDEIEVSYPFNEIVKYTLNESAEEVNLKSIIIDNDNIEEYINETDIDDCDITYIRTFNDTLWQSFYVPFDVEPALLTDDFEFALINNFHQYDDNYDGIYDRTELEIKHCNPTKILQANYPYLIRAKSTGTKKIRLKESVIYATEEYSIDCSSVELNYTFTGNYTRITDLRRRGCYYLKSGELTKAYSSSEHLEPFRWTMSVTARNSQYKDNPIIVGSAKIKVRIWGEGTTTDINTTNTTTSTTPQEIYSINGKRLDSADKAGVYIIKMQDGSYKKVFIK